MLIIVRSALSWPPRPAKSRTTGLRAVRARTSVRALRPAAHCAWYSAAAPPAPPAWARGTGAARDAAAVSSTRTNVMATWDATRSASRRMCQAALALALAASWTTPRLRWRRPMRRDSAMRMNVCEALAFMRFSGRTPVSEPVI